MGKQFNLPPPVRDFDRLCDIGGHKLPGPVTLVSEILKATAAASATLERDDLTGRSKKPQTVLWRQVAMWVAFHGTDRGYVAIGRAFDRDHATVWHAALAIEARLGHPRHSPIVKRMIAGIVSVLAGNPPPPRQAAAAKGKPKKPVLEPVTPVRHEPHTREWFERNDLRFRQAFAAAYPDRAGARS